MTPTNIAVQPSDELLPVDDDFAAEVLRGLSQTHKTLSPRFFYDARGSELFDEITRLPEYYPTRAETAILQSYADQIAVDVPRRAVLMEFGSGASRKTEVLLNALPELASYIAIDISTAALHDARRRLTTQFPTLDIRSIVADFSNPIDFPPDLSDQCRVGFFPGSTIGNFTPTEAIRLLFVLRRSLGLCGRLIVGVDLKKDEQRLIDAYNDSAGVTAAFNLNILARINRDLAGCFDLQAFKHCAIYNSMEERIEMHLVSQKNQIVSVLGRPFRFRANESIHTENSYKYTIGQFQNLARSAGWRAHRMWLDEECLFGVHELT